MQIKKGAVLAGLDIRMRQALITADSVYKKFGKELVITSGLEGSHSPGSLHYYGLAIDIRTNYFTYSESVLVYNMLYKNLPEGFDCILEKTHIHIEYDND